MAADEHDIERVREWIDAAQHIAVLTGSGISAESKIPTFRGAAHAAEGADDAPEDMKALWAEFDPQTLATPEAYNADPERVSRWYDWRRVKCLQAEPNPGHRALAEMQRSVESRGGQCVLLTQNVDGLHQRADSTGVVELHGTIHAWRGIRSGQPFDLPDKPLSEFPPRLETGEISRPGVVWFGEMLPDAAIMAAERAAAACDLFFSIGTSSTVWPAAGFIEHARSRGAHTVEINPDATPASASVDIALRGPSGEILPQLAR